MNKYYVGYTCDCLQSRLSKHLNRHSGYTKRAQDWEIVYHKSFDTKESAFEFEKLIKSKKSRKFIEKLIAECG